MASTVQTTTKLELTTPYFSEGCVWGVIGITVALVAFCKYSIVSVQIIKWSYRIHDLLACEKIRWTCQSEAEGRRFFGRWRGKIDYSHGLSTVFILDSPSVVRLGDFMTLFSEATARIDHYHAARYKSCLIKLITDGVARITLCGIIRNARVVRCDA